MVTLFIRAETDVKDLEFFPRDMAFAVVGAEVSGSGDSRWITLRQPLPLVTIGTHNGATFPMFFQDDPYKPMWYRVDSSYAGQPRRISSAEYERIWIDWFFHPSGSTYSPDRQLHLPISQERFSMEEVLNMYRMLRKLMHRVPEDFAHLGQVAQDPQLSVRPPGRTLCGMARRQLGLEPNDELGNRGRTLLGDLLVFDPPLQRVELVKPWRRVPLL